MQLKFQRSQRAGGVLGKTAIFSLDVRAEYSPTEAANIAKYKLGGEIVYSSQAARRHRENMDRHLSRIDSSSAKEKAAGLARGVMSLALVAMNLNISIASLGRGHHIECKDLPELLDAEKALMDACRNLKEFLAAAATFNGSVILVDFDDGEKIHISQGALELEAPPSPGFVSRHEPVADIRPAASLEQTFEDIWQGTQKAYRLNPKTFQIGGSILVGILILSVFGTSLWPLLVAALLVGGIVVKTQLA